MELKRNDIQARIEMARRQRSDALGEILGSTWTQMLQRWVRLLQRRSPTRFPWIETPT